MMLKQTKIVASISDQRCEVEFIRELFEAGMNVVRMNTAHASREGFDKLIDNVRTVSNRIGILMDTKGPEVRTTALADGQPIPYVTGETVKIFGDPTKETTKENIYVSYPGFVNDPKVDGDVLIDDGDLELKVIDKTDEYLLCRVMNDATLGNKKSVNVPGVRINLPSLTEKDKNNILYAIEKNIDFIAHSFVRNRQDVEDIKAILDAHNSDIRIIAKIENQEGVDNIDEILEVADGIMVARGDLGIEVPQERIPGIQRILIKKSILAKKTVIIATQMLHTMINNPRPTRAEISDIAIAVSEQADAIMLSGETAMGEYPVEAVQTMTKVAVEMEKEMESLHYRKLLPENNSVLSLLSYSTVTACLNLPIKAVIVDTLTGRTARYLAAYRGIIPVYAICYTEEIQRQLSITYGVQAFKIPFYASKALFMRETIEQLIDNHILDKFDQVVVMGGSFGPTRGATFMEISKAEDLLHKELPINCEK